MFVPNRLQVNMIVVSEAVGVNGVIRFTDYLVSGVVVVSAAFLLLLHSKQGRLSEPDWGTAGRWLYFGAGGCRLWGTLRFWEGWGLLCCFVGLYW